MADTKKRSNCPISCALEIWGDKWSLLIVRDLLFFKERTYSDFLKSEEQVIVTEISVPLLLLIAEFK